MKIQTGKGTIALTTLLAIWSVSMVVSLPGLAVSPILGRLHRIFGHATDLEIQMLTSLPSLLIIPFVLLAGKLSVSRNKLLILYTGLIIFFVSGLSCLFVGGMTSLIVVNGILGIGAGMVVPLSTGLVADYFSGRPRGRQRGLSSAISNVTLVLATSLTGWLATIDWHYPFLVYLLPGVSLLLTLTLRKAPLPDATSVSAADRSRTSAGESDTAAPVAVFRSSGSSGDGSLSQSSVGEGGSSGSDGAARRQGPQTAKETYVGASVGSVPAAVSQGAVSPRRSKGTEPSGPARPQGARTPSAAADAGSVETGWLHGIDRRRLGGLMLLYFFATYAVLVISFNLPFLIQQYKLTSSASGVMISLFFLAIMLPGLAVDRVIALLGKKTMFVSLLLIGAGLLLLYLMKSEFFVALGCFATGLGYGVIQPVVYNKAVVTASRERTTLALALVMSVNYLAILLCPFIVDMFAGLFRSSSSADFPFLLNALLTLIATVPCYRYRDGFVFGMTDSDFE